MFRFQVRFFLLLPFFLGIFLFISSCEQEPVFPDTVNADFYLDHVIELGDSLYLEANGGVAGDQYQWDIDGELFSGEFVSYIFRSAGTCQIKLKIFREGAIIASVQKSIIVLKTSTYLNLEEDEIIEYCFAIDNKVVLQSQKASGIKQFYVINSEIEIERILKSYGEVESYFGSMRVIGDSVLAFTTDKSASTSYLTVKSTGDNALNRSTEILDYNNGFIYSYRDNAGFLSIDYFDENANKLWTKVYDNSEYSRVINLLGDLFYLSFNIPRGELKVEKFKNPSVVLSSEEYVLPNSTESELVFVQSNFVTKQISFALYDKELDITRMFTLDSQCNLELLKETNGKMEATKIEVTLSGDFLVSTANTLEKYNSNWELLAEMSLEPGISGTTLLTDNLIFCYAKSNTNQLNLFFVDKHFQRVSFN